MPMILFHDLFPTLAENETRVVTILKPHGPLPPDTYAFVELFCDELDCDCRNVMVNIANPQGKHLATINHSLVQGGFADIGEPDTFLDPLNTQGPHAEALLDLFRTVALEDPAYVKRLDRHRQMVRDHVEGRSSSSPTKNSPKRSGKRSGRMDKPRVVYQLTVTLREIQPPIWRRLIVPGTITLGKLHWVIQHAMGWTNSHPHQFIFGEDHFSDPSFGFSQEWEMRVWDEGRTRLSTVLRTVGESLVYEYDFGDSWEHEVVVETIRPVEGSSRPRSECLDGARACPPEDVSGTVGYAEFLEAIADPEHEEHERMKEWIGGSFDPEAFDVIMVNRKLR